MQALRERVQLDTPDGKGDSYRSRELNRERRSKGKKLDGSPYIRDERVHNPTKVPPLCAEAWAIFWDLNTTRREYQSIDFMQLHSWCWLMDRKLDRWEVVLIRRLDAAWLEEMAKILNETAA